MTQEQENTSTIIYLSNIYHTIANMLYEYGKEQLKVLNSIVSISPLHARNILYNLHSAMKYFVEHGTEDMREKSSRAIARLKDFDDKLEKTLYIYRSLKELYEKPCHEIKGYKHLTCSGNTKQLATIVSINGKQYPATIKVAPLEIRTVKETIEAGWKTITTFYIVEPVEIGRSTFGLVHELEYKVVDTGFLDLLEKVSDGLTTIYESYLSEKALIDIIYGVIKSSQGENINVETKNLLEVSVHLSNTVDSEEEVSILTRDHVVLNTTRFMNLELFLKYMSYIDKNDIYFETSDAVCVSRVHDKHGEIDIFCLSTHGAHDELFLILDLDRDRAVIGKYRVGSGYEINLEEDLEKQFKNIPWYMLDVFKQAVHTVREECEKRNICRETLGKLDKLVLKITFELEG